MKSIISALILYLSVITSCHGQTAAMDSLVENIANPDRVVREKTLQKLMLDSARDVQVRDIKSIFDKISSSNFSPYYVYKSIYYLSKKSNDKDLISKCLFILENKKSSINQVIAALTFLEKSEQKHFKSYFEGKSYNDINPHLHSIFYSNKILVKLREDYYNILIDNYLASNPVKSTQESSTILRDSIVSKGAKIAKMIEMRYSKSDSIPISVIKILGEIGSMNSANFLFDQYTKNPTHLSALSFCSCMGSFDVNKVFSEPEVHAKEFNILIEAILGKESVKLEIDNLPSVRNNLLKNIGEVKLACRKRIK